MRVVALLVAALILVALTADSAVAAKRRVSVSVPSPGEITLKAFMLKGTPKHGSKFPRKIGVKITNRGRLGKDVTIVGRVSRVGKSRNKLLLVLAAERPRAAGTSARGAAGGGATDADIAINIPTFVALRIVAQKQVADAINTFGFFSVPLIDRVCDQVEQSRHNAALLFGTPFGQGSVQDLYELALLEACDDFDDDFPPRDFLLNFLMFGSRNPVGNFLVGVSPLDPTDLGWRFMVPFVVQDIYITTERPIAIPGSATDETTGKTVPGALVAVAGRARAAAFTGKPKYVVKYAGLGAAAGDSISVRLQDNPQKGDVARAQLVTPGGAIQVRTLPVG